MTQLGYRTLRENIVEAIRLKILNGELEAGSRIIEQELSDEFHISRGPIREALRQLEQEGMVEYRRNAGCSVREITLDDIYEIYLLCSTYEKLAVESYGGAFSEEDIAEMEEILAKMERLKEGDYRKVVELDFALHRIIVKKAGLPRLLKLWEEMNYGNTISCYAGHVNGQETARRQYPIHKKLVDACRTRDEKVICEAITDHYMLTINRLRAEA